MTIHVSIGNSDDKLSQARWAEFISDLMGWVEWATEFGGQTHGVWFSGPESRFQNMCVALDVPDENMANFRQGVAALAARYGQDSIAWLSGQTEFLTAEDGKNPSDDDEEMPF